MSTGAVAGVAVGAALGGVLLAALVGWLWWACVRKRRQNEKAGHFLSPGAGSWAEGSSYHAAELETKHDMRPELEDYRGIPPRWTGQPSPVESSASGTEWRHAHYHG
jgi:hypothetical protein